ncbi:MAG: hypothetical protein PUB18_06100 [bacterium]|nr:hypothetical protein [bacterium]
MLDLIQILECPEDLIPIFKFIKFGIYPIIQIGIPILLILFGCIDLGKAVMSSDDKEIKGATSKLLKRAVAAVAVFFVATIVSLLMNMLSTSGADENKNITNTTRWQDCWTNLTD